MCEIKLDQSQSGMYGKRKDILIFDNPETMCRELWYNKKIISTGDSYKGLPWPPTTPDEFYDNLSECFQEFNPGFYIGNVDAMHEEAAGYNTIRRD